MSMKCCEVCGESFDDDTHEIPCPHKTQIELYGKASVFGIQGGKMKDLSELVRKAAGVPMKIQLAGGGPHDGEEFEIPAGLMPFEFISNDPKPVVYKRRGDTTQFDFDGYRAENPHLKFLTEHEGSGRETVRCVECPICSEKAFGPLGCEECGYLSES